MRVHGRVCVPQFHHPFPSQLREKRSWERRVECLPLRKASLAWLHRFYFIFIFIFFLRRNAGVFAASALVWSWFEGRTRSEWVSEWYTWNTLQTAPGTFETRASGCLEKEDARQTNSRLDISTWLETGIALDSIYTNTADYKDKVVCPSHRWTRMASGNAVLFTNTANQSDARNGAHGEQVP